MLVFESLSMTFWSPKVMQIRDRPSRMQNIRILYCWTSWKIVHGPKCPFLTQTSCIKSHSHYIISTLVLSPWHSWEKAWHYNLHTSFSLLAKFFPVSCNLWTSQDLLLHVLAHKYSLQAHHLHIKRIPWSWAMGKVRGWVL